MGLTFFQPTLSINIDTEHAGLSQVFYPSMSDSLSENQSSWHAISNKGVNNIKASIPMSSYRWVRWDPMNGDGYFYVTGLSLAVSGINFKLSQESLIKNHDIASIDYDNGVLRVETIKNTVDPSLRINLPRNKILIIQIISYLIILSVITMVLIKASWFNSLAWLEREKSKYLIVLLVLLLQNFILFYKSYFQGYCPPWDFMNTYHALPYYLTELRALNIDTNWIPFQGMGYPRFMNLQNSFYYPVFVLLAILKKSYTIYMAVTFQGGHVLFASIGAAMSARLMGLGWRHALLAGVFYQFFGGFYSHASHPDIIRSYSFIPWLFAPAFSRWEQVIHSKLLTFSIAIIPFIVFCAWTGGYVGGTISTLFILSIVLVGRLIFDQNKRVALIIISAIIAGCLLAAIHLLPAGFQLSEIARSTSLSDMRYDYFVPSDIFSLVYNADTDYFSHDITMRGLYVGTPMIALIIMGLAKWRAWNKWVMFSCVVSILMLMGLLHPILVKVLFPLGLSRFVIADYSALIAFYAILLSVTTSSWIQNLTIKPGYTWAISIFVFLLFGNYIMDINVWAWTRDGLPMFLILFALILVMYFFSTNTRQWFVPIIVVIALFDWGRTQSDMSYFTVVAGQAFFEQNIKTITNKKSLIKQVVNTETCRPARIDSPGSDFLNFSWEGYYSGNYMMQDYSGPMQFNRQQKILSNNLLKRFAVMPWRMVRVTDETEMKEHELYSAANIGVECLRYGTSKLDISVNIPVPSLVVENEIYWLGWEAKLIDETGATIKVLKAINIDGFRGWKLPAGKYLMSESYSTPYMKIAMILSLIGLFMWIFVLVLLRGRCKF